MTNFIQTDLDHEDTFFINNIKTDVAKECNVCQSKIDVFWSEQEMEYILYIKGLFAGCYDLDDYYLEEIK